MDLEKLQAKLKAIGQEAQSATGDKLDALMTEAEEIKNQIKEANVRAELDALAKNLPTVQIKEAQNKVDDVREKRGETLKNGGAVHYKLNPKNAITTTSTLLEEHTASDIKPTFTELSSLINRVRVVPLPGGESYQRAYLKGYGVGDYTAEGADYTTAEPTFGYADLTKTKITAYAEETNEVLKLPNADYDSFISGGIATAINKKINAEILIGNGATGHFKGIFFNDTDTAKQVIDPDTDLEMSAIDETTLDEIIYSFGGEESVESIAVLILNKKDLKAFATLRDAQGDKVYDVVNNGNTGSIDGVPFIINSACKALSDSTVTTGAYCMAYGPLSNYEMAIFSDLETARSTDFKFKQGQIAFRGEIYAGGTVAAHNGFIRVKKGSTVAAAKASTTK